VVSKWIGFQESSLSDLGRVRISPHCLLPHLRKEQSLRNISTLNYFLADFPRPVGCSHKPLTANIPRPSQSPQSFFSPPQTLPLPTPLPSLAVAVCTIQTFKNSLSGPMLLLFASYYLHLGWIVIIFDRCDRHTYIHTYVNIQLC
jgi:hypothetical protein